MVNILRVLVARWGAQLVEASGAGAVVYGVAQFSHPAAWIVGGCAGLLKATELDLRSGRRGGGP